MTSNVHVEGSDQVGSRIGLKSPLPLGLKWPVGHEAPTASAGAYVFDRG